MAALFSDPHTLARDMLVTFEHPREGTIRMPGSALKLSDTPPEMRLRPPLMGEHTIEILSALGYSPSEIDKLVEQAVVAG
jgi:crotonobetainyl-CoA:carnitine CoA-transferase CaiB-like acyl-CoA transferase